jgi:oxygen-independent coproporphyrinogen-3 oxidase
MDKIIELSPTNITVHTFCVKKAADILRKNSNVYSLAGGDAAKSVSYSQLKAKFAGYKPYYMYRQKNTVGNLENVGFSIEGHEGLYNVLMMEDIQTIFAVGASAVTKLVHHKPNGETVIERIFNPKYPYEYLRQRQETSINESCQNKPSIRERIIDFYSKF